MARGQDRVGSEWLRHETQHSEITFWIIDKQGGNTVLVNETQLSSKIT